MTVSITFSTTYNQGRVTAVGRVMHYGKFKDGSLDGIEEFGANTLFDTELGYRWENIKFAGGARNLFNVYPDQVSVEANTNNGSSFTQGRRRSAITAASSTPARRFCSPDSCYW